MPTAQEIPLTVQENALATAMAGHIGDVTLQYTLAANEDRIHQVSEMSSDRYHRLVDEFRQDPKEALAWARESLLSIQDDARLTAGERERRLGRYLDAYLSLTLKLDHAAFPPTVAGEVRQGVPGYIPDGFADLGRERTLDAALRDREMISVDKRTMFERYRPVLKAIFTRDYSEFSSNAKKQDMFRTLAQAVYFQIPHTGVDKPLGGGKVNLGTLPEGVCRHQALTFQVLAQAVGLTSRMLKNELTFNGKYLGNHASNMIRINHRWFAFDVTNPDYVVENGKNVWRPGVVRADRPPHAGESRRYEGTYKNNGNHMRWDAHDRMFWIID